jgi:protein phosphatase 1G
VYDGHGGAEVAQYCSKHLPSTLKTLDEYKNNDFEETLRKGFLRFDELLLDENVQKELKVIAGTMSDEEADGDDAKNKKEGDDEKSEVENLYDEATMPIEEVLKRYSKTKKRVEAKMNENREKLGLTESHEVPDAEKPCASASNEKSNDWYACAYPYIRD